jgi:hypothetical protein
MRSAPGGAVRRSVRAGARRPDRGTRGRAPGARHGPSHLPAARRHGGVAERTDPVARRMDELPRTALSHKASLPLPWTPARVVGGELPEVIGRLKSEPRPMLRIIGSVTVVRDLAAAQLLHQLRLVIFPLVLGPDGESDLRGPPAHEPGAGGQPRSGRPAAGARLPAAPAEKQLEGQGTRRGWRRGTEPRPSRGRRRGSPEGFSHIGGGRTQRLWSARCLRARAISPSQATTGRPST